MTQYLNIAIILYGLVMSLVSFAAVAGGMFYLYCGIAKKNPAQVVDNIFNFLGVK